MWNNSIDRLTVRCSSRRMRFLDLPWRTTWTWTRRWQLSREHGDHSLLVQSVLPEHSLRISSVSNRRWYQYVHEQFESDDAVVDSMNTLVVVGVVDRLVHWDWHCSSHWQRQRQHCERRWRSLKRTKQDSQNWVDRNYSNDAPKDATVVEWSVEWYVLFYWNERYRVQRLLSFVLRTFSLFPSVPVRFYQLELERILDRRGHPKHRSIVTSEGILSRTVPVVERRCAAMKQQLVEQQDWWKVQRRWDTHNHWMLSAPRFLAI